MLNAGGVPKTNNNILRYDSQPGSNDWATMTGARLGIVAQTCLFCFVLDPSSMFCHPILTNL
eukprot:5950481-Alexandrium_andersonii.AAC.1